MSLFCDKYKPSSLDKVDYQQQQAKNLLNLIKSGDFPNLFVFGPSGAGKKTRIDLVLKEIYGAGVEKVHFQNEVFETPSKRKLEIKTISSNYHIEVNPSDVGIYDRVVIQDLIKKTASTVALHSSSSSVFNFKTIVVVNADRLTKDAQHALRRTMEKYLSTCRLILCAESASRMIGPIRSRCLLVRVAAPKEDEIARILLSVGKREQCDVSLQQALRIARESNRNLRRALLMLESAKVRMTAGKSDIIVQPTWLEYIRKTAKMITEVQNVRQLVEIRNAFYELEAHLIPPEVIFKNIVSQLLSFGDRKTKYQMLELASRYEHNMRLGSKRVFHFEAFVAHTMILYRKNLVPLAKGDALFSDFSEEEENL